jgi:hypothetical protein
MNTVQKSEVNRQPKRASLIALAAFAAMAFSAAHAQSTSSRIIGKAPTDGSTISVRSDTGVTRSGTANGKGRYTINSLPPGTYMVSLEKDGQTLASLSGVPLFAAKAFEVDFSCDNGQCTAAAGH